jgi:dihydropteroate synthase
MQYHEAANDLLDLRRYSTRPGTDATTALLSHLGDPHDQFPSIQIAGSNGKGSTARMVESALSEAGLSVGIYTSPHLDDPRDRIRVDGRKISEAALVEFVEQTREYLTEHAADGTSPTFFETMTAMALWEFGRQDVDIAVLEVGIGGPLDATSAVDPVASAVTTVALEHTDVLGDDVETIARDMAGIEPDDGPIVTAATGTALRTLEAETDELLTVASTDAADEAGVSPAVSTTYHGRDGIEGRVTIETGEWSLDTALPLLGAHQARNAGVAAGLLADLATRTDLGLFEAATIERGFRNAHWPGRFEVMDQEPLVVLDGAHNPDGIAAATETLAEFEYDRLHAVVGVMADKDLRGIASALPELDHVVACEPDHTRAENTRAIARAFEQETGATVETRADVAGALADRLDAADETDCVLVTGSLYTVGEARTCWTRSKIPKRVDSLDDASRVLADAHVTDAGAWRMRGKAVHRVVKTRVQPRQAQYLKEEMLSLGGECAVSGLAEETGEKRAVVLMGTLAQFKRLCGKLDGQPFGLSPFADELRAHLDIETETEHHGYPWEDGTAVMGILNVTPDSFHDGGEYDQVADATARAQEMVDNGVDIVDVGGESTRPGADPVSVAEEKSRVVPVIEHLADLDVLVSIDTRKAEVARAALDAGADILNDVSGLEDPEMRLVAAESDVPVVVMHSIDTPVVPENEVHYDDVVEDVIDELTERVLLAEKAGLDRSQVIVDPGLGFGKTAAESFELLGRVDEFAGLGCPVLVGHSHKSMFGHVGRESGERYEATIAATALAAERGADIVRVHDVEGNVSAVDVVEAVDSETS